MSKFLYLFRGGDASTTKMSPEAMQTHMQKWGAWMQGLAKENILIDGLPLAKEGKIVGGKGEVITDGPFAEGKEIVGGYLMVNADSLAKAVEISKGCPILEFGDGTVEVREIQNM
ncbi:MAG: hypothetical protein DHS20C18_21580 [Saprospiraceae bacterium]|nr:MAG: hypothetical protein DHS20C18_21580 [Saprospiraceae bacterium]